jgi:hypothetical protein
MSTLVGGIMIQDWNNDDAKYWQCKYNDCNWKSKRFKSGTMPKMIVFRAFECPRCKRIIDDQTKVY